MDLLTRREQRHRQRRQKRRRIAAIIGVLAVAILAVCVVFGGKGEDPVSEPIATPEPTPAAEPSPTPTPKPQTADEFIAAMPLDKKLMQLFVVDIDSLTGVENTTLHGNKSKSAITENAVGGIIYDGGNIESKAQAASMLSNVQSQYKAENGFSVFLGISEECGDVSPAAAAGLGTAQAALSSFADGENFEGAYNAGAAVAKYISAVGFNMNLAPNCTIPDGIDAETFSSIIISAGDGMASNGVNPVYKAFPGEVVSGRTKEQMEVNEILPFTCAINNGAKIIMVSSSPVPVIAGDSTPCMFSKAAVSDYLRTSLDFDGLVMTEPLSDKDEEVAVKAMEAGCDLLLMPKDLKASVAALKSAVESGRLTEERINESVRRILKLKLEM